MSEELEEYWKKDLDNAEKRASKHCRDIGVLQACLEIAIQWMEKDKPITSKESVISFLRKSYKEINPESVLFR